MNRGTVRLIRPIDVIHVSAVRSSVTLNVKTFALGEGDVLFLSNSIRLGLLEQDRSVIGGGV